MDVYLAYSGSRAKHVAQAFKQLVARVLPQLEVGGFESDLALGESWREALRSQSAPAEIAILFLTRENLGRPWVHYEAGQLAAASKRVVPYLVDLQPSELPAPLSQFQCVTTNFESNANLFELLATCDALELERPALASRVQPHWPEFLAQIADLPPETSSPSEIAAALGQSAVNIDKSIVHLGPPDLANADNAPFTPTVLSTEQAFERIGAAVRQALLQTEKNFDQAREDSKQFFRLTITFASLGFAVVLGGVVLLLLGNVPAGVVASAASIVPELTAALFFRKDRELRETIASYHAHILESQRILTMIDVCETISDQTERDSMKGRLIRSALDIA